MISRIYKALRRRLRARKALAEAREASRRRIQRGEVKRVLVVCYGNIYRSPFCGASLRKLLPSDIEVRTSGFHRVADRPSPPRHVTMSQSRNIDLSAHRSSKITPEDLNWADIVVLMDRHNWDALDQIGADHSKLVWLGAFGSKFPIRMSWMTRTLSACSIRWNRPVARWPIAFERLSERAERQRTG